MARSKVQYQPIPSAVDQDDDNDADIRRPLQQQQQQQQDISIETAADTRYRRRWARAVGTVVLCCYTIVSMILSRLCATADATTWWLQWVVFVCGAISMPSFVAGFVMDPGVIVNTDADYVDIDHQLSLSAVEHGAVAVSGAASSTATAAAATAATAKPSDDPIDSVHPRRHALQEYNGLMYEWCGECALWRPTHARHCSTCGFCVRKWNQHCGVLCNCVGERTHRVVLVALLSSSVGLCVLLAQVVIFIRVYPLTPTQWWAFLLVPIMYGYFACGVASITIVHLFVAGGGVSEETARIESCSELLQRVTKCSEFYSFWTKPLRRPGHSRYTLTKSRGIELGYWPFH